MAGRRGTFFILRGKYGANPTPFKAPYNPRPPVRSARSGLLYPFFNVKISDMYQFTSHNVHYAIFYAGLRDLYRNGG